MPATLMHISDLHAGPPFLPDVAKALTTHAHDLKPDLLVLSGDFVQRADRGHQWQAAREYLATLPQPHLYVSGNHDVPLFNLYYRLFQPYRPYQRNITTTMNPIFAHTELDVYVVGGDTAHGITIAGGYLNTFQIHAMEAAFAQAPATACKIAVLHHPVIDPPDNHESEPLANEREVVAMLARAGVELVLNGHVHFFHVGTVQEMWGTLRWLRPPPPPPTRQIVLCTAGTATSQRGRGPDLGKNSFNLIRIDEQTIRVQPWYYQRAAQQFEPQQEYCFERDRPHAG